MAIESAVGVPSSPQHQVLAFDSETLDQTQQTSAEGAYSETLDQTQQTSVEAAAMSAEQRRMEANFKACMIENRKTARVRMTAFAELGESIKMHGFLTPPPFEIVEFPDLLERAWGWDRILPYRPRNNWSQYSKYLREYYRRNAPPTGLADQMGSGAAGDGSHNKDYDKHMAALVDSCISMQDDLKNLLKRCPKKFHDDEISRTNKIINCVSKMSNVTCSEFPAAAIALECITKETDLMCELAISENIYTTPMHVSSDIRVCASRFMSYKGGEHFTAAAATMMGVTREAKVMCEVLRKECDNKKDEFLWSYFIRERTLGAMIKMYREYPAEESTSDKATNSKLVHDGSADLEMESVKKDNSEERNATKDKNKEEPVRGEYYLHEKSKSQRINEDGVRENLDKGENNKKKVAVQNKDILVRKKPMSKLKELSEDPHDREFDEGSNLLSPLEQMESNLLSPLQQNKVSGKAVENASKSAAQGRKFISGCFRGIKSGRKANGIERTIYLS